MTPSTLPVLAAAPESRLTTIRPLDSRTIIERWVAGKKPNTLRAYEGALAAFARWAGEPDGPTAAERLLALGHDQAVACVLAYQAEMREAGKGAGSVNQVVVALRGLAKLAHSFEGGISWTLDDVKLLPTRAWRDVRGPQPGQVADILALVRSGARTPSRKGNERKPVPLAKRTRDAAIVRVLWDLALRRVEVCRLDLADYSATEGTLQVWGKGHDVTDKEVMTVPPPTIEAINAWVAIRGTEPGPLFLSLDNARKGTGRLDGGSIARITCKLGRVGGELGRVGGVQRFRPHQFRHGSITSALNAGKDIRHVMKHARHSSPTTTCIYDDARHQLQGAVATCVAFLVNDVVVA